MVTWGGTYLIKELLSSYRATHERDPFEDLILNDNVENIFEECFIIVGKNSADFAFIFNRSYLLLTKVIDCTEENRKEKRINKLALIEGFSKSEKNKYCV